MEERKKHIDDLFREGLEGYREVPDASVWTSLEQRLPEKGGRPSFLWLWIILMLALLSSMGYYVNKNFLGDNIAQTPKQEYEPASGSESPLSDNTSDDIKQDKVTDSEREMDVKTESKSTIAKEAHPSASSNPSPGENEHDAGKGENISRSGDIHSSEAKNSTSKAGVKQNSRSKTDTSKDAVARNRLRTTHTSGQNPDKNVTKESVISSIGKKGPPDSISDAKQSLASDIRKNDKKVPENPNNTELSQQARATSPVKSSTDLTNVNKVSKEPNKRNQTIAAVKSSANSTTDKAVSDKQNTEAAVKSPELQPQKTSAQPAPAALSKSSKSTTPVVQAKDHAPGAAVKQEKNRTPLAREESNVTTTENPKNPKNEPVTLREEPGTDRSVNVKKEEAKVAPIAVQAAPNELKPKPAINSSNAKPQPIAVTPEKTYGIKMDEWISKDEDGADDDKTGKSGGGTGGGAVSNKNKNRNNGLKIDGGVKLGYERGFANVTTSTFTGNIFLQWNISPRTSLVLQPGLRYHSINKTSLFPQSTFHQVNSETLDSAHVYLDSVSLPDFFVQRSYIYRSSYDSISVSYAMNPQKYIEVELPLLLQYKLAENISILGGIQLAFGKVIQVQSNMQRFQRNNVDTLNFPIVINDTTIPPPSIPGQVGYFSYNSPSISELDENKYRNPVTNPARFGAMLGFSYEYKRRLLIDLLVRKNLSNLNFIPNEEIRKIYSQPYFRITVGYKLFNSK